METATHCQTTPPSGLKPSSYRPEIDGLRALAIIAVIIYHFNRELLPGGYLGVDIFFVISGFVITASLAKRRQSHGMGSFLLDFYERRIRRLLPALLVCVTITSALLCLVDPSPGIRLGIAWRSLLGFSNIALYNLSTDYFSASTEINPFTHTWSLGVETQFYLLFPFLLWWTGFVPVAERGAAKLTALISILSIASLSVFSYRYPLDQPAAFFLISSRFWQMGAGCLLFLASLQNTAWLPGWFRTVSRLPVAIVLIAMVVLMLLPLPLNGAASVGIVVLTAVLLADQRHPSAVKALLCHPRVVFVGLISYSLYLWHWSVIVISRWTIGLHWWSVPFQLLLIAGLAWISYRYVERPLRIHRWSSLRWRAIAYGMAASLFGAGVTLALSRGGYRLLFLGAQKHDIAMADNSLQATCQQQPNYTMLFAGDSHANHYAQTAAHSCSNYQINLLVASTAGMPYPVISYTNTSIGHDQEMDLRARQTMEFRWQSSPLPPSLAGVVLLAFRGSLYFSDGSIQSSLFNKTINQSLQTGETIPAAAALSEWIASVEELVSKHPASNFVLLLPTPEFQNAYPIEICIPQWFRPARPHSCEQGMERSTLSQFNDQLSSQLRESVERHPNLYVFDAFSALCPPAENNCKRLMDGRPLYVDQDHLSKLGANRVIDQLVVFLRQRRLWQP